MHSAQKPRCLQCFLLFSKSLSSFFTYVVLVWSLLWVSAEDARRHNYMATHRWKVRSVSCSCPEFAQT
jgi:hypothetical protein